MRLFHNLTLSQKLLVPPALTLARLVALQATNSYITGVMSREVIFPTLESLMLSGEKTGLKALVDSEAQTLGVRLKTLGTREEKMAALVSETDPIRFFEDRSGYFFPWTLLVSASMSPSTKAATAKT